MATSSAPPTSNTARISLLVIAVTAAGLALFFLRSILTPLALALFLMVLIDGLSRVLRQRVPALSEPVALVVAILVTVLGFGFTVVLIGGNFPSFIGQLVADTPRLNAVIHDVAQRLHMHNPPSVQRLARQLDPAKYAGGLAQTLQGMVSTFLFILIYLGFLFASRAGIPQEDRTPVPHPGRARQRHRRLRPHPQRHRALPVGADRHRPDDRRRLDRRS
ncbi:MAG: hypothetical protein WDN45_13665 [Caulobacteraceae bacterium]